MASADYVVRGPAQSLIGTATLAAALTPLQSSGSISGLASGPAAPASGSLVLIGREFCRLVALTGTLIQLDRGVGDTIPRAHAPGTRVWFVGEAIGHDGAEWPATGTVAVKLLPSTAQGGRVPAGGAPPKNVVLDRRFERPYPPGLMQINGEPWFKSPAPVLDDIVSTLTLTWARRNRLVQHDILLDHLASDVSPEVDQTTRVEVFNSANVKLATYDSIAGTSFEYERVQGDYDFDYPPMDVVGYFKVWSERDALLSLDAYRIPFVFVPTGYTPQPYGLGYRLGRSLGGVAP